MIVMETTQRDIRSVKNLQIMDGSFRTLLHSKNVYSYLIHTVVPLRSYRTYREMVRQIHLDYLNAGATVIRTNTFEGALPLIRKKYKVSIQHYGEIINEAVKRAREAIEKHVERAKVNKEDYWVLGSCGSVTGCRHFPLESLTKEMCKDYHRDRIQMLLNAKVDGLALETIDSKVEADALLELLEEFPNAYAYMSFRSQNGITMLDELQLLDVIRHCYYNSSEKLFAIGINCVAPKYVKPIVTEINEWKLNDDRKIPIVICPNNHEWSKGPPIFKPMDVQSKYPVLEWKKVGIRYLGGCCSTLPDDIKAICQESDKWKPHM